MAAADSFDRLRVISDLHFAARGVASIISPEAERALAGWVRSLKGGAAGGAGAGGGGRAQAGGRLGLVLNGDVVDFLASDDALPFDPESAARKLGDILYVDAEHRQPRPFVAALRDFLDEPRHALVVALGNHDVELALPDVLEAFVRALAGGDDGRRGRIRLALNGAGYACLVGGRRVYCVHGNDADPWNEVDHETIRRVGLRRMAGRRVEPWVPNAGSLMVVKIMNEIKRRYPFVDLLKPEAGPLLGVLLALDKDVVRRQLSSPAVGPLLLELVEGKVRAGGVLAAPARGPGAARGGAASAGAAVDAWGGAVPSGVDVEALWGRAEAYWQSGRRPEEIAGGGSLGLAGYLRRLLAGGDVKPDLYDALAKWAPSDRTFALDPRLSGDPTFAYYDTEIGDEIAAVVTGHTHLARACLRKSGKGLYFNSGTWADLIDVSKKILSDQGAFGRFFEAVKGGQRAALAPYLRGDARTVVALDAREGGALRGELRCVKGDDGEREEAAPDWDGGRGGARFEVDAGGHARRYQPGAF